MTVDRIVKMQQDDDVLRMWVGWSELLIRPSASPFVVDLHDASEDLIRIFDSGFPADQMETWLQEWPTPHGWTVLCQQGETKISSSAGTFVA